MTVIFLTIKAETIDSSVKNYTDALNIDKEGYINMPFNEDSSKIQYYEVVTKEGYSKSELYDLLLNWSIKNYPFKEKPLARSENLKILVRGSFPVQIGNPSTDEREVYYVLELTVKDNKFKIEFNNFYLAKKYDASFSTWKFIPTMADSKIVENELEKYYYKKNRKPRQLVFKNIHEGIIKIKNSILSDIKKEKDW